MLLQRLFATSPTLGAGRDLYAAAVSQARRADFYRAFGVADTVEGRFELYSLHVALLLIRLKGQGQIAAETAQHLFDAYARALDDALRELGVSDVKVGRRMKALGQAFYGRLKSYGDAIEALPASDALEALLQRTALEERAGGTAVALARYVVRAAEGLKSQDLPALLQGRVTWPEPMEPTHG